MFDKENLKNLLKDFYNSVGIKISLFDADFNMVIEYPENLPRYCQLIRSTDKGKQGCKDCDRNACIRAKDKNKAHLYTCHAGLIEAITPLESNGIVLGYAILAHMLVDEDKDNIIKKAINLAKKYQVNETEGLDALNEIKPNSKEKIEASVKVLDVLTKYLTITNLVKWKNEGIEDKIDKYIKDNIKEKITSNDLCNKFNCSRTYLYHLSLNTFNMSIKRYIEKIKIEKAKEYLKDSKSVKETSIECGFIDPTYFTKVFKKEVGVTPKEYLKKNN